MCTQRKSNMAEPGKIAKTENITFKSNFGGAIKSVNVRKNRTTAETIDQFNRIYQNTIADRYHPDLAQVARIQDVYGRTLQALGATNRGTALNNLTATLISRRNNRR